MAQGIFLVRMRMSSWYGESTMFALYSPTLYFRCCHDSLVKIKKNRQFWKRTSAEADGDGKMVVAASNGLRITEFTAYSLLFTVPAGNPEWEVHVIADAAGGCAESSVARSAGKKKFAVIFADKFAVPRAPVN